MDVQGEFSKNNHCNKHTLGLKYLTWQFILIDVPMIEKYKSVMNVSELFDVPIGPSQYIREKKTL